jgi:hypothetical protein
MKIILDLDSTLCQFAEAWLQWLFDTGRTETLLNTNDVLTYYHYTEISKDAKKFFRDNPLHLYEHMKPYPGAAEFINFCKENYQSVSILTHSDDPRTTKAKILFCNEHFDMYHINFVDKVHDKYKHTSGAVLVDDYPFTIINHIAKNETYGIIFDWQRSFGWSKISSYKDLIKEVNPDLSFIHAAWDYEDVKQHLEFIKRMRDK